MAAVGLIARALLRAWRRHPLRAVAALVGVTLGAMLATLVVSINDSVSTSARSASGTDIIRADYAIRARSAGGITYELGRRIKAAAKNSRVSAVLQVNTRLANSTEGETGGVLSVLGVDRNAEAFFPKGTARKLIARRAPADAPGIVVGRAWLKRNGLQIGDKIRLATPGGATPWTIVGEIPGDIPNDGAIAVGDIESIGFAFERQNVLDTLYVQLASNARRASLISRLRKAAGDAAVVGRPDIVGQTSARSLVVVQAMLVVAGLVGLLSAAVVVFVCWRLLLEDERASVARFRLNGGTPLQLANGAGLVLIVATLLCSAVGIPAGVLCERMLRGLTSQLVGFTGLAAVSGSGDISRPAIAGAVGAIAIGGMAWAAGIRSFVRVPAIDAVRPPDPPPPPSTSRAGYFLVGAVGFSLAVAALVWLPFEFAVVGVCLAAGSALAVMVAAPGVCGRWLAAASTGFVGHAAGRHLAADARRTTAIVMMVSLSITAGLTLGGVAASYQSAIDRSVASWTHADLYVRQGRPGATLRDARFPQSVQRELRSLPGVKQAGAFTYVVTDYRNRNVMIQAYDTRHIQGIADLITYAGPRGRALWAALDRGEIAVSQSMARLDKLAVGDAITIPGTAGSQRLRIAAVIDDYVSDGGTLVTSMPTFSRITGESRIDDIPIKVARGTSATLLAARVRAALPQYRSLSLTRRNEFRSTITAFITNVVSLFRGLALAAFFIVFLAAVLTLAASLTVRRRSLAIGQLCGATDRQIRRQLSVEAISMAVVAWLVAVATTCVLIPGALRAMAAKTGLLPAAKVPLPELVLTLPAGIGVALLAAIIVSRMTLKSEVAESLRFE